MVRLRRCVWLIALLVMACAGTASNILHVQAGPGGLSSKKEEINDLSLSRSLAFGEVSVRPLGLGSSMEAQVIIRNKSRRDVMFEYRFIWYDASGFEISSAASWTPYLLSGREARGFKATAPAPNATNFKCMIRRPHPLTDTGS